MQYRVLKKRYLIGYNGRIRDVWGLHEWWGINTSRKL